MHVLLNENRKWIQQIRNISLFTIILIFLSGCLNPIEKEKENAIKVSTLSAEEKKIYEIIKNYLDSLKKKDLKNANKNLTRIGLVRSKEMKLQNFNSFDYAIKDIKLVDSKHAKVKVYQMLTRNDGKATLGNRTFFLQLEEKNWKVHALDTVELKKLELEKEVKNSYRLKNFYLLKQENGDNYFYFTWKNLSSNDKTTNLEDLKVYVHSTITSGMEKGKVAGSGIGTKIIEPFAPIIKPMESRVIFAKFKIETNEGKIIKDYKVEFIRFDDVLDIYEGNFETYNMIEVRKGNG